MNQGSTNADACRAVGVHRRTGARWRNGRVVKLPGGEARTYLPVAPPVVSVSARYLSEDERIVIADGLRAGLSRRAIAARLPGRAVSTVYREITRNRDTLTGDYRPHAAHQHMLRRRPRPKLRKLATDPALRAEVQRLLDLRWSPEQIAKSLAKAASSSCRISTEAIYQALYSIDTPLERDGRLRTGRLRRVQRRHPEQRRSRFVVPMQPLSKRPDEVAERLVGGHWEGDLIIGKGSRSAIGTLVERVTRFTILVHLGTVRSAEHLRDEMIDAFGQLPAHARRSLTWDQGMEMCHHHQISAALTMPVWFCDPHAPWQRGTNENTNGLLRQYFPKGTELSIHSRHDLARVARELNDRPRKTMGWDTPAARFATLLAEAV